MARIEEWIDKSTKFTQGLVDLLLKLIFELFPVLFVIFIIVAIIAKAFRVIVLGENP